MQLGNSNRIYAENPSAGYNLARQKSDLGSQNIEFVDILRILARRFKAIILGILLCLIPAILYITFSARLYNATTSILVDPRQGRSLNIDVATSNLVTDAAQIESQIKLISSTTVLKRVVESEKLLNDPEFGVASSGIMDRIFSVIGGNVPQSSKADKMAISIESLSKNVSVKRPERTYVVDIQVSSQNAEKSARLANAIAKAYMDDSIDARNQSVAFESGWVRDRLADVQEKMTAAEARIEDYKEKNKFFDASGKLVNDEQITEISNEVVTARSKTAETRARLDQVQKAMRGGKGLDSLGESQKSSVLEKLRTQAADIARQEANLRTTLGPRHPSYQEVLQQSADTRALINEELRRVANATETDYQVAKAGEASLEKELQRLKSISSGTNQLRPKLRELEREAESQRLAFEKFSKIRDSIQQQGVDAPVARVIAPAIIPDFVSSPRKIPIILLALAAGLGLGVALALIGESMSRKRASTDRSSFADSLENNSVAAAENNVNSVDFGVNYQQQSSSNPFSTPPQAAPQVPIQNILQDQNIALANEALAANVQFVKPANKLSQIFSVPYSASGFRMMIEQFKTPYSLAVLELCSSILKKSQGNNSAKRKPIFVLLTSFNAKVGKTTLCANLGAAAAAAGIRTLMIDAAQSTAQLSFYGIEKGRPGMIPAMGRMRLAFAMNAQSGTELVILSATDGGSEASSRLPYVLPQLMRGEVDENFDLILIDGDTLSDPVFIEAFSKIADQILIVYSGQENSATLIEKSSIALNVNPSVLKLINIQKQFEAHAA